MKKHTILLLLILAMILLVGCGATDVEENEPETEETPTEESEPEDEYDIEPDNVMETDPQDLDIGDTSTEESATSEVIAWDQNATDAMANYMNEGMFAFAGTWKYGFSYDSNGIGLYKIKVDGSEKTKLTDEGAKYISVKDGWVYFVDLVSGSTIIKVRQTGSDQETIVTAEDDYSIEYMFVYDDNIYYTKGKENEDGSHDSDLFRCDLNGENTEKVIDGAVYYPYIIGEYIYYQEDADYSYLYRCDLDGNNPEQITEDPVYNYVFDGEYIYYVTFDGTYEYDEITHVAYPWSSGKIIKRIEINGDNSQKIVENNVAYYFVVTEDRIIYIDADDSYRLYSCDKTGSDIQNLSQESYVYYLNIYGDTLFFIVYSGEGYTIDILECSLNGLYVQDIFAD